MQDAVIHCRGSKNIFPQNPAFDVIFYPRSSTFLERHFRKPTLSSRIIDDVPIHSKINFFSAKFICTLTCTVHACAILCTYNCVCNFCLRENVRHVPIRTWTSSAECKSKCKGKVLGGVPSVRGRCGQGCGCINNIGELLVTFFIKISFNYVYGTNNLGCEMLNKDPDHENISIPDPQHGLVRLSPFLTYLFYSIEHSNVKTREKV
jgi:hypothetical protein